jgi:O-glycosyl hydrolase
MIKSRSILAILLCTLVVLQVQSAGDYNSNNKPEKNQIQKKSAVNPASRIITINATAPKQLINMVGGDMERSQSFLQRAANPQEIANWLYKDMALMTCRVSYDKQQELTEGTKNLAFYDNAILSMKMVKNANPNIRFYATMKSDYNGYDYESNLPAWICNYNPTTWFNTDKYARFLADYLQLMHTNGVTIYYLSVSKEWTNVMTAARTISTINTLKPILQQRNVPVPLFTDPGAWAVNQAVTFVNSVISNSATNLFHAFSTHDYNNSKSYYPDFVAACIKAGKYPWNDETYLGNNSIRSYGEEPASVRDLISSCYKRSDMYAAGVQGEIFFENFSRGINAETRSIYFTQGTNGRRLRAYYISKEFANNVYNHYYLLPQLTQLSGVKSMAFKNNQQVVVWVVNSSANNYQDVDIKLNNITIGGVATQHIFDSLTVIQGEKQSIQAYEAGTYQVQLKPLSINFFRFPVAPEPALANKLESWSETADFGSLNISENNSYEQTLYFNAYNPSGDVSLTITDNPNQKFQLLSFSSIVQRDLMWREPVQIRFTSNTPGVFTATLRVTSGTKQLNIPVRAETYQQQAYDIPFVEMFPYFQIVDGPIKNIVLNNFSTNKGWGVYKGLNTNNELRIYSSATENDPGYFLTPEINFNGPFQLRFYARMYSNDIGADNTEKAANNGVRNILATIGNDTIYDHKKNGGTLYQNFNEWTCTYEFTGKERIKFFPKVSEKGVWEGIPDGMAFGASTNGVRILTTTLPTVNVAYGMSLNAGNITQGTTATFKFRLKGWNLSSPLLLTEASGGNVRTAVKNYSQNGGVVDADIDFTINAAQLSKKNYLEKITLRSENNQIRERSIWISYNVVTPTAIENVDKNESKVYSKDNHIFINSTQPDIFEIYNISGQKIHQIQTTGTDEKISIKVDKSIYIVKSTRNTWKIII